MFDILIVGAGPAGSFLAYLLAQNGIKVALIDKKAFPRDKLCGGGVCARSIALLPFDISSVVEETITTAFVSLKTNILCKKSVSSPIIYMVKRKSFDAFLVKKAISQGVHFFDQTKLEEISHDRNLVKIRTSKGLFRARLIAGADGALSKTAKLMGLGASKNLLPAIETEISISDPQEMRKYKQNVHFDLAIPRHGYGWVFPKRDHLSVGLFSTRKKEHALKRILVQYVKLKGIEGHFKMNSVRGYMIPAGIKTRKQLVTSFGLLLGDAAGFADPITGEGIYHALAQAEIAAANVESFLNGSHAALQNYERQIMQKFKREHLFAWLLGSFFYNIPLLGHAVLKRHVNLITNLLIDVITGKRNYQELFFIALMLKKA